MQFTKKGMHLIMEEYLKLFYWQCMIKKFRDIVLGNMGSVFQHSSKKGDVLCRPSCKVPIL